LKVPGVDGRIILKLIFKKWDGGMDWIDMVLDRDTWQALVTLIKLIIYFSAVIQYWKYFKFDNCNQVNFTLFTSESRNCRVPRPSVIFLCSKTATGFNNLSAAC
jgi:hypothetical protein